MRVEEAARRLEALGNPTRLQIYRVLVRAGHAGLPVGRIQERLGLAASTLSHHIKTLVNAGLIGQERVATTLICRVNYAVMNDLVGFLVNECCADATHCIAERTDAETG
jgi:DNA-binding transcriptional ArsR family regulator